MSKKDRKKKTQKCPNCGETMDKYGQTLICPHCKKSYPTNGWWKIKSAEKECPGAAMPRGSWA